MVDPPNAACVTIALWSDASVRMSRVVMPRACERHAARAPSGAPCRARSAGRTGASAEWPSDRPSASPTTCDVAAVPRNWQPPPGDAQARQPRSAACFERDLAVREARADGLHAAGVLAVVRQQRHAAGHEHARQIVRRRRAPSSSPAVPCRRWRRRARRCASAASGSAGGRSSRRRCDTAGCRTSPACPACGRRTDRCRTRRTGSRRRVENSAAAASISRPTSQWPV